MRSVCQIACVLLLGSVSGRAADTPDPRKLEAQAVTQRRQIQRGEIELTAKGWDEYSHRGRLPYEFTAVVAFDGKKIRSNVFRPAIEQGSDGWKPANTEIRCFGDRVHIWYSDVKDANGRGVLMNVTDLDQLGDSVRMKVADPRWLGLLPTSYSNLVHHRLDSVVGCSDYKTISIERETYKGIDCWKVTKLLLNGIKVWTRFVPDKGWSVLRVEIEAVYGGQTQFESVESDLRYYEPAKLWFPAMCHFQVTRDGKQTSTETLQVRIIQLGKPVYPSSFTLAGLGIPAGTGVQRIPPDQPGILHWDGHRIVSTRPPSRRTAAPDQTDYPRLIWISCTLFFSFTTAACVWILLSRRRLSRPPCF